VRPSAREPLSALRLVSALIQAGWPAVLLGYYRATHAVLPALVAVTDRQIIYGGAGVCAGLRTVPTASLHGPRRVCAVVPAAADPAAAASHLLPFVAGEGGRFCTTVRVLLCLGDPALLAAHLARLLDVIPFSPSAAGLPLAACVRPQDATATEAAVASRLGPGDRVVTCRPIASRHGHLSYLAPTLIRLADRPHAELGWGEPPLLGFEAPFPLATIVRLTAD
jgi:acyl-CoA reductase-like NAD-dependent aldehyde dehydrogenase